ncbi:MAG TPA: hypothetical protein VK526_01115, partial [Bradyrhizobium sp.]|nr:hypothetical protein [Bradyrhizobium sp.]
ASVVRFRSSLAGPASDNEANFRATTSLRGALATKQSILSLRGEMDCFVASLLAMTVWLFDN